MARPLTDRGVPQLCPPRLAREMEALRAAEENVIPLPRRAPVRDGFDPEATWRARADRHAPPARIDWINVVIWGAVLLLCAGVWAAILSAVWDGLAAMIDAARAAQGRARW
jgi:hypothetical protein